MENCVTTKITIKPQKGQHVDATLMFIIFRHQSSILQKLQQKKQK